MSGTVTKSFPISPFSITSLYFTKEKFLPVIYPKYYYDALPQTAKKKKKKKNPGKNKTKQKTSKGKCKIFVFLLAK